MQSAHRCVFAQLWCFSWLGMKLWRWKFVSSNSAVNFTRSGCLSLSRAKSTQHSKDYHHWESQNALSVQGLTNSKSETLTWSKEGEWNHFAVLLRRKQKCTVNEQNKEMFGETSERKFHLLLDRSKNWSLKRKTFCRMRLPHECVVCLVCLELQDFSHAAFSVASTQIPQCTHPVRRSSLSPAQSVFSRNKITTLQAQRGLKIPRTKISACPLMRIKHQRFRRVWKLKSVSPPRSKDSARNSEAALESQTNWANHLKQLGSMKSDKRTLLVVLTHVCGTCKDKLFTQNN